MAEAHGQTFLVLMLSLLAVARATTPEITTPPSNVTVNVGEPFSLTCIATGDPTPELEWEMDSSILQLPQDGISHIGDQLMFTAAAPSHAGQYTCVARNSDGMVHASATVEVLFAPDFISLTVAPSPTVLTGTMVTLFCSVHGFPSPNIIWYKNSVTLGEGSGEVGEEVEEDNGVVVTSEITDRGTESMLKITTVEITDAGFYRCEGNNSLGTDDSDSLIMLLVYIPPKIVRQPVEVDTEAGLSVELICEGEGFPPLNFTWFQQDSLTSTMAVEVVEVPGKLQIEVEGNSTTLHFPSVSREDSGVYFCQISSNYGNPDNSTLAQVLVQALPFPGSPLTILTTDSYSIDFIWDKDTLTYPAATGYVLEYKLDFHTTLSTVEISTFVDHYVLMDLLPNAPYQLRLRVNNPVGLGDPGETLLVYTDPGVPLTSNTVLDYTITHLTTHSITVQWTIPDNINRTSYNFTRLQLYKEGQEVDSMTTSSSTIQLTNLQPATLYEVEAEVVFVGGDAGPPVRLARATLEAAPATPPEDVIVTATSSSSISLSWLPPNIPNGNITTYTIYYQPLDGSSVVDNMTVGNVSQLGLVVATVIDLLPFTEYELNVTANTSGGEGPAATVDGMTDQAAPLPPTIVELFALNSSALQLSWQLEEEDIRGILANFTVSLTLTEGGGGGEITVEYNVSSLTLFQLLPYRLYNVCVSASTEGGGRGQPDCDTVRTLGAIPDAVVTNLSVSETCPDGDRLTVSWDIPDPLLLNGPLDEVTFDLLYQLDDGSGAEVVSTDSYTTSFNLTGLEPYTTYTVEVSIRNLNGSGEASDSQSQTTCDDVAPPPTGLEVTALSSTSLKVSWLPVPSQDIQGMLVDYIIRIESQSLDPYMFSAPPSANMREVVGLIPYTTYDVSVATVTRGGRGTFSSSVSVTTLTDAPGTVLTVVSLVALCPPSLLLTWSLPETEQLLLNGPEEDTWYRVRWEEEETGSLEATIPFSIQTTSYTIPDLSPTTSYTVTVVVANDDGEATPTNAISATTNFTGEAPSDLQVTPSQRYLSLTWTAASSPQPLPYLISYSSSSSSYLHGNITTEQTNIIIPDERDFVPFTQYIVTVQPFFCGPGPLASQNVSTLPAPPGPTGVAVVTVTSSSVTLELTEPDLPNGVISQYKVDCSNGSDIITLVVADSNQPLLLQCVGLSVDSAHSFSVSAINQEGEGETLFVNASTSCSVPSPKAVLDGSAVHIVRDESCEEERRILVVVGELEQVGRPLSPPLSSYSLEQLKSLTEEYAQSRRRSRRQDKEGAVYIAANISADQTMFELGDNRRYGGYQNYPLDPGRAYTVAVFALTSNLEAAPAFSAISEGFEAPPPPTEEENEFPVIAVAAGAGGTLFLIVAIFCVVMSLFCCCRRQTGGFSPTPGKGSSHSLERANSIRLSGRRGNKPRDPLDEYRTNYRTEALESHPPIPLAGFVNKLLVMRTNDNQLFLEEFGSIEMTPQQPCSVAELPANHPRNRYNNILTYDHSRVKLSHSRGQHEYINASYCSGYMKVQGFIATQGPLPGTVPDFWRLVWEQNSRTIVMLTNTQERGKTKCEVYWPREVGCTVVYGNIEVTLTEFTQLADYTIRSFTLHKVGSAKEGRDVKQFHFTSWPDHGVPQYATAMLSMVRRVHAFHATDITPMVVHCSAGVGRTGTFIVIYSMLERIRAQEDSIDIYGHVSLLRTQRNYMVQTEDQYFFIYEAVAEAAVCGNTEVALERLGEYLSQLMSVPSEPADHTGLELEFKRLAIDKSDPFRFAAANRDVNKSKNRFVNVLPFEHTRVVLQYQRAMEGSDYINANFIDGYHYRNMFIATQGPLHNTLGDFWRMAWESNVPIIVMLTKCEEKGVERSAQYWPKEAEQSATYGNYIVAMAVERKSEHYTYRDLLLTDTQSGRKRQIRHFHFLSWPEVGVPSSSLVLVDFLREIQKNYSTLNTKSPIAVHCSNGIGRSGVFIALHIILERMVGEGLVDVFQTVKNLRIQRPAMVQTLEQYQFCYNASLDYLEASDLINQLRSSQRSESRSHRTPSNASEMRASRRSPARSDSVRSTTKRSSRNFELAQLGNGVSTVYGGSEATSTFGTTGQGSPTKGKPQSSDEGSVPSLLPLASPVAHSRHLLANPRLAHLEPNGSSSQGQLSQGSNPYLAAQGSAPQLHLASGSHSSLSQSSHHTHTLPSHPSHRPPPGTHTPGTGGSWGRTTFSSQGSLGRHGTMAAAVNYPASTFGVTASQDSLERSMANLTLNLNNSNNNVVDVYVET